MNNGHFLTKNTKKPQKIIHYLFTLIIIITFALRNVINCNYYEE